MSIRNYCLPAAVWSNLEAATTQGEDPETDGATLVLVAQPYHDELVAERFQLELPDVAQIRGIEISVRRAADVDGAAADDSVRLLKAGIAGRTDRARPEEWSAGMFHSVVYGGPTDLWGQTWTAADLNAPDFGVSLSTKYTQSAGNARAYVDIVTAKIYYTLNCR
jgi:hypothetical protein